MITNEGIRERIDSIRDYGCSWGAAGIGRFRVSLLRQRSSFMIVLRVIPFDIPSLDTLGLPPVLAAIESFERGLVVVAGPTASGRTATLAAFVHSINAAQHRHIVTLEQTIEYLHRDLNGSVTQREVGVDTDTFATGLRSALTQDPDIVVVDASLDASTIETALVAAETGRLVLTTLPAMEAAEVVSRLVSMFPSDSQDAARRRLSHALKAIVVQRLLPRADGKGMCAALEIMWSTPATQGIVEDRGRAEELKDAIADGNKTEGMQTLEQHLADLVAEKTITKDAALAAVADPDEYERAASERAMRESKGKPEQRRGARDRRRGVRDRRRRKKKST